MYLAFTYPDRLAQPKKAVSIYMNAGLFEVKPESHNILKTNRQLYAALQQRGYSVHYQEFASGHDYFSWRANLALGLMTLLTPPSDSAR
jgi:enterochelin esterase family protein